MKTILVTYLYPLALKFLPEFLLSISNQTNKEFELYIFNDGVIGIEEYLRGLPMEYKIFDVQGSISEIRFQSLEILKTQKAENFIFQDVDDKLSNNRIEVLSDKLEKYSLVCNDLTLFNENGILKEKVWENRLGNNFVFTYKFIYDYNIVGLGNTAIKKNLLDCKVEISLRPIAVDWFIFFQILYNSKIEALFTSDCTTMYRQHDGNIAGINEKEIFPVKKKAALEIKKAHFSSLNEIGISTEFNKTYENSKSEINISPKFSFWWE